MYSLHSHLRVYDCDYFKVCGYTQVQLVQQLFKMSSLCFLSAIHLQNSSEGELFLSCFALLTCFLLSQVEKMS